MNQSTNLLGRYEQHCIDQGTTAEAEAIKARQDLEQEHEKYLESLVRGD